MGLDIDFYVFKNKFKIDDIDNETPTLYLRKPYLISSDLWDICKSGDLITRDELFILKDKLKNIINNFHKNYNNYYNITCKEKLKEEYFDDYVYNLKKYVDLYDLICDVLRDNEKLLYVVITP